MAAMNGHAKMIKSLLLATIVAFVLVGCGHGPYLVKKASCKEAGSDHMLCDEVDEVE